MDESRIEIRPQPGPQTEFLSTKADIAIYGGAAGGGKTFGLLMEPLRHVNNEKFGAVIFRRTSPQIRNEGGLWDTSEDLYANVRATPKESTLEWVFPSGMKVKFAHLEHEKNKLDWQGSQIPLLGFDELTHFTESQFWYLVSRNRSTSGVPGYIRATTNPDADSWVANLIAWWINQETGFPIIERSGVIRWFIRKNDTLIWADSKEELIEQYGADARPKSLTFIVASLYDNKILMEKDPDYLANLESLPRVERERLLGGNWKVRPSAGMYFKRSNMEVVDALPPMIKVVRYWDRASTEKTETNNPDWTVGLKLGLGKDGYHYVMCVERFQKGPAGVETSISNTASQDGGSVSIGIEQDPGQAGKVEANYYVRKLIGFTVKVYVATKSKITRAGPVSSQAERGNVKVLRGPWNKDFFDEIEAFPEGAKDDQVDALSGAFTMLNDQAVGSWTEDEWAKDEETFASGLNESNW